MLFSGSRGSLLLCFPGSRGSLVPVVLVVGQITDLPATFKSEEREPDEIGPLARRISSH